jgi:hypothetical protein
LDCIILVRGAGPRGVGRSRGRVPFLKVDKIGCGAPASSFVPGIASSAVAGEVSFLSAVEAWPSGLWPIRLILGSVGVSYFHEASVGLVRLVGMPLVIGSGAVKVHRNCRVVYVTRGVR